MKNNSYLILIFLLIFCGSLCSQEVQLPKDSIFVVNTFNYDLDYGISMYHKFCENQKTFLKKGTLLSETFFTEAMEGEKYNTVSEVVYYYYNPEKKLISRESMNTSGHLLSSRNIFYNSSGNIALEVSFKIENDKPVLLEKTAYSYTDKSVNKTIVSGKKKIFVTIIKSADMVLEQYSYNKYAIKEDSILSKEVKKVINNSKVISETTIIKKTTGESDTLFISYSYTDQNLLAGETYMKSSKLQKTVKYNYTAEGRKSSMTTKNEEGKNIKYLGYETHEFHREFPIPESLSVKYLKELKIKKP